MTSNGIQFKEHCQPCINRKENRLAEIGRPVITKNCTYTFYQCQNCGRRWYQIDKNKELMPIDDPTRKHLI